MNLHNDDVSTDQRTQSPRIAPGLVIFILSTVILTLAIQTFFPLKAEPSPVTPAVARLLGWCEEVER